MLTKETFQQLSTVQQMLLVMDNGYNLLARKEDSLSIKLFKLNGFFVEVKYDLIENKIRSVEVVLLDDVTDAYLSEIQIDNIF